LQPINRVGKAISTDGTARNLLSAEITQAAKYQFEMCVREIGVLRKIASDKQLGADG
jgi:hypothetical protein